MKSKSRKTRNIILILGIMLLLISAIAFALIRNSKNITTPVIPVIKQIPGLVLYYPFDGNAKDLSGNNTNGDVHGAVLATDRFEKQNSAYYFDGIDDSITFDATKLPTGSSPRTISAWIKADSFPPPAPQLPSIGSRATIIGWGHDDLQQLSNMEIVNNNLTFHIYGQDAMSNKDVGLDEWYHLVVVYSGQKYFLYLNGIAEEREAPVLNTADLPGRIGAFPDQSSKGLYFPNGYDMSYFHGIIDEVCIYNQALSETQVLQLYHAKN